MTNLTYPELRELDVMTAEEAALYCRVSTSYLRQLRLSGKGPSFIRHTRAIRYPRAQLDRWMESRMVRTR